MVAIGIGLHNLVEGLATGGGDGGRRSSTEHFFDSGLYAAQFHGRSGHSGADGKRKTKDLVLDSARDHCRSSGNSGHLDRWLCRVPSGGHSVPCNRGRGRVPGGGDHR